MIYFSNRRNTEYEPSVRNVHKNTKSIFRDDLRQKQPENFTLKQNGLFSSFLFATVLVAFIALEGNDSRAVKMHSQDFLFLFVFIYLQGAFNFKLNDTLPLLTDSQFDSQIHTSARKQN